MERRLTTILAADVVGYSRLMGEDEAGTLAALKALRRDLVKPKEIQYRGRTVKLMGDGALMEFSSVVDAVHFAVEVQSAMNERNAAVPEDRRIVYRIGLNIGDIIVEGDDIFGDGVNVAARLEGLSEAGGICLAQSVFDQVKDKLDLTFEHLGEREVKNIAEPVSVYRVVLDDKAEALVTPVVQEPESTRPNRWPAIAATFVFSLLGVASLVWWQPWAPDVKPASVQRMAFPLPDKPSIAVLPFDNLSADPEQDYFVDGVTEDIITELSRFTELFVIARTSTFAYRDKAATVAQVAEELGVRYVVEGSVRRTENALLITVQLIDATSGAHLWAERYEKPVAEFRLVEEELLNKIVSTVASRVEDVALRIADRKHTNNLSAYELVLRGYALIEDYRKASIEQAKLSFEQATELDPQYARAYSGLAEAYLLEYVFGWSDDGSVSLGRAREATLKALAWDDNDNRAHSSLGWTHIYEGRIDQGIAEIEKAMALNPNDAQLLATASYALTYFGEFERAAEQVKRAMRLNPFHPDFYYDVLGWAHYFLERYDDALLVTTRIANPNAGQHRLMAATYARLGRLDEARAHAERALEIEPDFAVATFAKNMPFKNREELEFYLDGLRMAGLPEHPPLDLPDKPSIAVLPFTNMSDDPSQEYFADGMTEDLITDLSKISGLFVIARNSSFSYKNQEVKVRQVAEDLGVRYVLEGSVRRAGDQVRINAQLIDATTDGHVWADRYDGSMVDVFELQDRVTQRIVGALAVRLTAAEQAAKARQETENPDAYDAFLQGWEYYQRFSADDFAKAIPYFETAIELDPNYGLPYAALASLHWKSWRQGDTWTMKISPNPNNWVSVTEVRDKVDEYVKLAIKKPTPLAHQVASAMEWDYRQFDAAVGEAEQAVSLDPNDPDGHIALAWALIFNGSHQDALESVERAMRLDPRQPENYMYVLGMARLGLGQYDEAVAALQLAHERNPEDRYVNLPLAAANVNLGRYEEAGIALKRYTDVWTAFKTDVDGVMNWWPFRRESDIRHFGGDLVRAGLCCEDILEEYVERLRLGGTLQ